MKKPSFNEDFIRFWLMKFRKFDISQKKQRKALIGIFVNAIFLYDDRMLITFNYKDGTQTVRFEDALTADCGEKVCVCEATKAPVGLLSNRTVLRKQDGGPCPDKFGFVQLCWTKSSTDEFVRLWSFFVCPQRGQKMKKECKMRCA